MTKQEFVISQLAEYFQDPSRCGVDRTTWACKYYTADGKMCVAGKNFLPAMLKEVSPSATLSALFNKYTQRGLFKPDVVDVISNEDWMALQAIHDYIAFTELGGMVETDSNQKAQQLGFDSYEDLKEQCVKFTLPGTQLTLL